MGGNNIDTADRTFFSNLKCKLNFTQSVLIILHYNLLWYSPLCEFNRKKKRLLALFISNQEVNHLTFYDSITQ